MRKLILKTRWSDLAEDRPQLQLGVEQAANEVRVFLPDPRELELWSRGFFVSLVSQLGADH